MQTNYRTKFLTHSIKCVWMEHQENEKGERENVVGCHMYTHSTPIIDLINIMLDLVSEKFIFWFLCFNILSNLTSIWFEPKQNGNSKRKKKFVNQFSFAWNFLYIYCFNAYECGKNINISGISSRLFGIKKLSIEKHMRELMSSFFLFLLWIANIQIKLLKNMIPYVGQHYLSTYIFLYAKREPGKIRPTISIKFIVFFSPLAL